MAEIACFRCRNKTDIKTVKYDMNGENLICPECYEKQHSRNLPGVKPGREKKEKNATKYRCTRCNYSFAHKDGSRIRLECPFCGKSDKITFAKLSAEKIIDQADDFDF